MKPHDPDYIRNLMMASIDGEASAAEERTLQGALANDPSLAKEYQELKSQKNMMANLKTKPPHPRIWDTYWGEIYNRIERALGWVLLSVGLIVLLIYGVWQLLSDFFLDPEYAWWLKAAVMSVTAGSIILLVSVIREKLFLHKNERYKDIEI